MADIELKKTFCPLLYINCALVIVLKSHWAI